MIKTITNYYCDLCEEEINFSERIIKGNLETKVMVATPTEIPYVVCTQLHLCNECLDKYIDAVPIVASRTQGNTQYSWR